jgi:branched-chain amino acid transport system ATP-binding protein
VLEITNLTVKYGAAYAVRDVSLNVQSGEFVAIIGPNGAGKTTLLRGLSRLVPVASGSITFNGERIERLDPWEVVKQGIIHVPEGRKLVGTASVLDNLKLGAYRQWTELQARLRLVYEIFPILGERRKQQVRTLSGGEQQMVAIGRALMANPKLLLLDEVTFGLAPRLISVLRLKLKELHRLGIAVLLAEQNAELALTLADRCYVLEYGSVARRGTADELRADPKVRASYLGL